MPASKPAPPVSPRQRLLLLRPPQTRARPRLLQQRRKSAADNRFRGRAGQSGSAIPRRIGIASVKMPATTATPPAGTSAAEVDLGEPLHAAFLSGSVVMEGPLTYIGFAGACSGYGDKRACNKRTGPGCDSRRLHQPLSVFSTAGSRVGNGGPTSIDGRVKKTAFARPGPPYRAIL